MSNGPFDRFLELQILAVYVKGICHDVTVLGRSLLIEESDYFICCSKLFRDEGGKSWAKAKNMVKAVEYLVAALGISEDLQVSFLFVLDDKGLCLANVNQADQPHNY